MLLLFFATTLLVLVQPVKELRRKVAEDDGRSWPVSFEATHYVGETHPHEESFPWSRKPSP